MSLDCYDRTACCQRQEDGQKSTRFSVKANTKVDLETFTRPMPYKPAPINPDSQTLTHLDPKPCIVPKPVDPPTPKPYPV
jgi:hypothetical protein